MKKIVSLIIGLSVFATGCMHSMANFDMPKLETKHQMTMESLSDCCLQTNDNCDSSTKECCYSPYQKEINNTITNTTDNQNKKIKLKISDYSFLAILQEGLENNNTIKLNSPPKIVDNGEYKDYSSLTGIIKNNC
ncbi:MAG: hypothetical protein PHS49_07390 [Candidatus Gracilibacteria bacterium]|nr:hypothetical protein [Candidatus Gracilibacteria bacterium]